MSKREPWNRPLCRPAVAALLLGLFLGSRPAMAGVGDWTPVGPDGGSVLSLAVPAQNPQVVYAVTEVNGVFRSSDAGRTWVSRREGMGPAGAGLYLAAVEVDPRHSETVYAVGYQDLWKSLDGGLTWRAVLRKPNVDYRFTSLAIDPRNPARLYLGTTIGVLRSLNAGASWQLLRLGTGVTPINTVAVDPEAGWVYAGTEGRGLLLSQDGGAHWTRLERDLPPRVSYRALEPTTYRGRPLLFAATRGGVFRSLDRGRSWAWLGGRVLAGEPEALAFDSRTGRVYVGTLGAGVWAGADRGSSWQPASTGLTDNQVTSVAVSPSALYAGLRTYKRSEGLFRSTDAGATWQAGQSGLSGLYVPALAASPDTPGLLLAAADRSSLMRRASGGPGSSWQVIEGLPVHLDVHAVAFDPAVPATVYASAILASQTAATFLRSDDRGLTWSQNPIDVAFARLWVDRGTGTLWGAGPGLYRSDDHGVTWTAQALAGDGPFAMFIRDIAGDPLDANLLYVAGWEQISFRPIVYSPRFYRSTDRGVTWQRKESGLASQHVFRVVVDPATPATIYAVAEGSLYRSPDRGETWSRVLSVGGFGEAAFQILPTTPRAFVFATNWPEIGVLVSRDEGQTWRPFNVGLGDRRVVTDLVADPFDETKVYAATTTGGVFSFEVP